MSIKSPVLAQYFALSSIVSFPFLLSGKRASICSLLNALLLSVRLVRARLIDLRASESGREAPSSLACLTNSSELELADKLYFFRNWSKIETKLLVLGCRGFGTLDLVV